MITVDHRQPTHDGFCRCTTCKPSPVGARSASLMRVRIGTLGLLVAGIGLIAARATGVIPATNLTRVENVRAR